MREMFVTRRLARRTGRPCGQWGASLRVLLFISAVCRIANGDSIVIEGKRYENVTVVESPTRYYVRVPEEDRVISVSKSAVDPSTVVIDPREKTEPAARDTNDEAGEGPVSRTGGDVARRADVQRELWRVEPQSKVLPVPYVQQKPDRCGAACIEMITAYFGKRAGQHRLATAPGGGGRRGANGLQMMRTLKEFGIDYARDVWWPARDAGDFEKARLRLIRAVEAGYPVLLGVWWNDQRKRHDGLGPFDHYVVLVGYDIDEDVLVIHDPERSAMGGRPFKRVSFEEFRRMGTNRFKRLFSVVCMGLTGTN